MTDKTNPSCSNCSEAHKVAGLGLAAGAVVIVGLLMSMNTHNPACIAGFCVFVPLASLFGTISLFNK